MICERWGLFENFLSDMGARPEGKTLDRIDHDGNYGPDNCRWATPQEQQANMRSNKLLTFNGRTQHMSAWCREFNIDWGTLRDRLARGWTIARALTAPVIAKHRRHSGSS